ncbi:MAG: GyrI-like domain-containing protein [Bacteroidetes bacterium]|nr:GyrI-like domain-containing protein [Bacteroidota bacterium]
MTSKTDLTKTDKKWYKASTSPEIIHFDKACYLAIDGKGDPSGAEYANDLRALYAVAYALKFKHKEQQQDFVVAKLEGQWSFDEKKYGYPQMDAAPLLIPRSEWIYRSLIRLPEFVSAKSVREAVSQVLAKKDIPAAEKVHFFELPESYFVQILHLGAFEKEPDTLKKLKAFMDEKEFVKNGLHHEIYLSDFRKTAPEKLKTILREPVC